MTKNTNKKPKKKGTTSLSNFIINNQLKTHSAIITSAINAR